MCGDPDKNDRTKHHTWFHEDPTDSPTHVLTASGVENIAQHKYKPGDYTHLDTLLNPVWTWLTELLPMWLAPNMVTTLGGLHCGLAYGVLWYLSPNLDTPVPSWAIFLSGYCNIAYYTFDCMDGKQARRTETSSPLGQLFDHGFDCICNLALCANCSGWAMIGGTLWYFGCQCSAQFSFFMAQWEEYYTGVLPHATGKWCGVTEVNYGLGVITILQAFIDRESFWTSTLSSRLPPALSSSLPPFISTLEMRNIGVLSWFFMNLVLVSLSLRRVMTHPNVTQHKLQFTAFTNLITPFLLAMSPFILPANIIQHYTRYVSVALGLAFSLVTKKIIVFSMAKMNYASIQMDVLPLIMACVWVTLDERLTQRGAKNVFGILCLWNAWRLLRWANLAIDQICARLGIYCFTIKKKDGVKKD